VGQAGEDFGSVSGRGPRMASEGAGVGRYSRPREGSRVRAALPASAATTWWPVIEDGGSPAPSRGTHPSSPGCVECRARSCPLPPAGSPPAVTVPRSSRSPPRQPRSSQMPARFSCLARLAPDPCPLALPAPSPSLPPSPSPPPLPPSPLSLALPPLPPLPPSPACESPGARG